MKTDLYSERGTTIIETTFAAGILMVSLLGLGSMVSLATMYTENHGHLEARTTEYAQDKLEHLLALAYGDISSDTAYFPALTAGGTGLAVGGSLDPAAPVDGYVDWLSYSGEMLHGGAAPPEEWFYERLWEITEPSAGLKQITVVTTARAAIGGAMVPRSVVMVLKSNRF
jgi:hypothetical protein